MLPLDIVLVDILVVLVHALDKAEGLGEERSVLVGIHSVLASSLEGLVLVD